MKRSGIALANITDMRTLTTAFHAAARGKRGRDDVEAFRDGLYQELKTLRQEILAGTWSPRAMRAFRIRDPKPRLIHAPMFRDRVLHHAVMAHVGPALDRGLVFDTYACRAGKGTLAAVQRAQSHAARYPWFAQLDVRGYFANIDHDILLAQLAGRLKNRRLLDLLERIVRAHASGPGCGLPIGTLTSQHFANFYLAELDRLMLETCRVRGFVRYMDDLVFWADDRAAARAALDAACDFLSARLRLTAKEPARLGPSEGGLNFLGFRILPNRLLLSRRRKRRYSELRAGAEQTFLASEMDAAGLQSAYARALSLTIHADAAAWRREQLRRKPVEPVLEAI